MGGGSRNPSHFDPSLGPGDVVVHTLTRLEWREQVTGRDLSPYYYGGRNPTTPYLSLAHTLRGPDPDPSSSPTESSWVERRDVRLCTGRSSAESTGVPVQREWRGDIGRGGDVRFRQVDLRGCRL